MSISLSQVEFMVNLAAIVGIVYHVGKKEGEIIRKVDEHCDRIERSISLLKIDYAKLAAQITVIKNSAKDREMLIVEKFDAQQKNDDRRIKKCSSTVSHIEDILRKKNIYLEIDRHTHF